MDHVAHGVLVGRDQPAIAGTVVPDAEAKTSRARRYRTGS
jgi:hypothetical protein